VLLRAFVKNVTAWTLPAGCEFYSTQSAMPAEALALLDRYAYEYGESYDSYLATEDDRQYFWSPRRRGVIGFVRWRRTLNILGGLLAAPQDVEDLLEKFLEFARLNRLTVNFVNIGRDQAKLFRRHNFKINKCGEELIVRLDRVNWQGKPYEWLRRQENYCVRQRLRVEEIDPENDPEYYREHIVPQLEEVNREHLTGTVHGRELVFFEGRFDPWSLRRRRLFVTTDAGRIVAFVICNPALAGDMWAIEMYRRRADALRGVIPYSMLQVLRQLKDEGVLYGSLSSVPFLRCGPPNNNDDLRLQGGCQFFWYGMNWLFDIRGIFHFKSRFRPDSRELYMATYPRMTFESMFSLLFSWELLRIAPLRLARHVIEYWRSRKQRKGLVSPAQFAERKILKLRRPIRVDHWPTADEEMKPSRPLGIGFSGIGSAESAAPAELAS
jgi:phosphatidylglycerol lysyltransferase